MFKLAKRERKPSLTEVLINETIDKVAFDLTANCYNPTNCNRLNKKLKRTCLLYCKRIKK